MAADKDLNPVNWLLFCCYPNDFFTASFSKDRDSELIAGFSQELTISKNRHLAHHFANNLIQLVEIGVVDF